MDLASMASAASAMKASEYAYEASIKTAKMALDAQKLTGNEAVGLIQSAPANNNPDLGKIIDLMA